MMDKDKEKFLHDVRHAHDRFRWALDISDMEAASHWEGDLFALAIEGAGISIQDFTAYVKNNPKEPYEV